MGRVMEDVLAVNKGLLEEIEMLRAQLIETQRSLRATSSDNRRLSERNKTLEERQKKHEETLRRLSHERNVALAGGSGRKSKKKAAENLRAWKEETAALMVENRRLRALTLDMWHELSYMSVRAEGGANGCLNHMAAFEKSMQELGLLED